MLRLSWALTTEVNSVDISTAEKMTPVKNIPDTAISASNEKNPRDNDSTGDARTAAPAFKDRAPLKQIMVKQTPRGWFETRKQVEEKCIHDSINEEVRDQRSPNQSCSWSFLHWLSHARPGRSDQHSKSSYNRLMKYCRIDCDQEKYVDVILNC